MKTTLTQLAAALVALSLLGLAADASAAPKQSRKNSSFSNSAGSQQFKRHTQVHKNVLSQGQTNGSLQTKQGSSAFSNGLQNNKNRFQIQSKQKINFNSNLSATTRKPIQNLTKTRKAGIDQPNFSNLPRMVDTHKSFNKKVVATKHNEKHFSKQDWKHHWKHNYCHWWYDYCRPIGYYYPNQCVSYRCNYVVADAVLPGGTVIRDARWYLGLSGMVLLGKGFGVEAVEQGSPAEQAGLRPGMVITRANGIELFDEAAMPAAVEQSGGVLNLTVLASLDAEPINVTIQMIRVATQSF